MLTLYSVYRILFVLSIMSAKVSGEIKAPRPEEPSGIENPTLQLENGEAVCCPLPRDVNITGNLYVGGNLIVEGFIIGPIIAIAPFIIKPLVGTQACIIFETAASVETARICADEP